MMVVRGIAPAMVLATLLAAPLGTFAAGPDDVLLAWQMETVQPGHGSGIADDDTGARGFGSGVGSGIGGGRGGGGVDFGFEPVRPGGRGPLFENETRRPAVFGEGREPFYRPGPGRNCTGEGPGRVCF